MPPTKSYLITILVHMLWHSGELHILASIALLLVFAARRKLQGPFFPWIPVRRLVISDIVELIYRLQNTPSTLAGSVQVYLSLQWRHNEGDGISNHRRLHYLLNRLFRYKSKKTSKLRGTGLCYWNSPVTVEFIAQRASKAEMFPFDNVIMLQLTSHELHGVSSHCQQVAEAQQRKHKSLALLAFRVSTGD